MLHLPPRAASLCRRYMCIKRKKITSFTQPHSSSYASHQTNLLHRSCIYKRLSFTSTIYSHRSIFTLFFQPQHSQELTVLQQTTLQEVQSLEHLKTLVHVYRRNKIPKPYTQMGLLSFFYLPRD